MSRRDARSYLLSQGLSVADLERRLQVLRTEIARLREKEAAYWADQEERIKAAEQLARAAEEYARAKARLDQIERRRQR